MGCCKLQQIGSNFVANAYISENRLAIALKFYMVPLRISMSFCTKFHCPAATLRLCSNLPKQLYLQQTAKIGFFRFLQPLSIVLRVYLIIFSFSMDGIACEYQNGSAATLKNETKMQQMRRMCKPSFFFYFL